MKRRVSLCNTMSGKAAERLRIIYKFASHNLPDSIIDSLKDVNIVGSPSTNCRPKQIGWYFPTIHSCQVLGCSMVTTHSTVDGVWTKQYTKIAWSNSARNITSVIQWSKSRVGRRDRMCGSRVTTYTYVQCHACVHIGSGI